MAVLKFVIVAFLIAGVSSRAAQTPKEGTPPPNSFEEVLKQVQEVVTSAGQHVSEMISMDKAPSATQLLDVFKNQSQELATRVSTVADKIKHEVDTNVKQITNHTVAEYFTEAGNKLQKTVEDLQKQINEKSPEVAQFQQNYQKTMESFVAEVKKIADATGPQIGQFGEEMSKVMKEALQGAAVAANTLQEKIHEVTQHTVGDHQHSG